MTTINLKDFYYGSRGRGLIYNYLIRLLVFLIYIAHMAAFAITA